MSTKSEEDISERVGRFLIMAVAAPETRNYLKSRRNGWLLLRRQEYLGIFVGAAIV